MQEIEVTLKSGDPEHPDFEVPVVVRIDDDSIWIRTKEIYGEATSLAGYGEPIVIENYHGDLRVLVWGDINREDPTHVISLKGAREEHRLPEEVGDLRWEPI